MVKLKFIIKETLPKNKIKIGCILYINGQNHQLVQVKGVFINPSAIQDTRVVQIKIYYKRDPI
jgi:hypothetical protein